MHLFSSLPLTARWMEAATELASALPDDRHVGHDDEPYRLEDRSQGR
jgi:hypothetical protein